MALFDRIKSAFTRDQGSEMGSTRAVGATAAPYDVESAIFSAGWNHLKLLNSDDPTVLMEAFEENSRLQIPVRAIAEDLSVVKCSAVRRTITSMIENDFQDVPAPKSKLAKFIADPNPFFTWGQLLMLTSCYYDTPGIALWRLIEGPFGLEAWPVPPNWVLRKPDRNYDQWKLNWPFPDHEGGLTPEIPESEMVAFWQPKLTDPYREWASRARSVDNEISIDRAMGEFLAYSFANESTPSVIVGMPGANPVDLEREQAKWTADRSGPRKARKAVFINSDTKVTTFKSNHKDLEFNEGRRLTRDLILQAYGVPPERAGVLENANRSTIDAADFQQQSKNVLPRLTYFAAVINKKISPRLGREILVFENPVKESLAERLQTAEKIARLGIGSNNEARKLLGLPPTKSKFGNYVPVPVNNVRWYDPEKDEFIDPDPLPDAAEVVSGFKPDPEMPGEGQEEEQDGPEQRK